MELEEADERAEAAESQLQKTRQRMKSGGASLAPTRGVSGYTILFLFIMFYSKKKEKGKKDGEKWLHVFYKNLDWGRPSS